MPRFDRTITLGNIITVLGMIGVVFSMMYGTPGDAIRVEAKAVAVAAAFTQFQTSQLQFQQDVRQQFSDTRAELLALRAEMRAMRDQAGVRWSELPPKQR